MIWLILKILFCIAALGALAWLFDLFDEFARLVVSLLTTYISCWLLYLVFWHIHKVATLQGLVW